jgi:hypothetical protein
LTHCTAKKLENPLLQSSGKKKRGYYLQSINVLHYYASKRRKYRPVCNAQYITFGILKLQTPNCTAKKLKNTGLQNSGKKTAREKEDIID